jgi:hypothetical protein
MNVIPTFQGHMAAMLALLLAGNEKYEGGEVTL